MPKLAIILTEKDTAVIQHVIDQSKELNLFNQEIIDTLCNIVNQPRSQHNSSTVSNHEDVFKNMTHR